MKISIITVCFNASETIGDSLTSVAEQSYRNIEHIVIDGASNDNTLDLVRSFQHVSRIVSAPDEGIYDAMNKGIALATGEVIGILNADDVYADNNTIAKVMHEFATDAALDAVYGDLVFVDRHQTEKVRRTWIAGAYTHKSFYQGWMPPHPTLFVRKAIYEKYGTFNTELKTSADYELMLRYLFKHAIRTFYLPMTMVKMRMGGQSNSSFQNRIRANREDRMAWQMNGLKPHLFTLILKPLRKINQFI